ncbi:putative chitinase 2 [Dermatophagoides farinae]|uniref:chitinase n=1 Tax=Dermatophagoides farinae TaxID=6954 RepID=A0A922KYC1_DERFA|nr:probable chitinase 2 [Dermatophagoides farinae]KAH9497248.1 Cht9p [Dermatophagoides farinae]
MKSFRLLSLSSLSSSCLSSSLWCLFFLIICPSLSLSINSSVIYEDDYDGGESKQNELEVPPRGNTDDNGLKLICYYGSWAVYRPGRGKFPVEEIDPFLCSHIIYGFAGLSYDNKIRPLDPYNDLKENWGKGAFLRFTGLKKINKKLKTMIAIGGWNEGSVKYSNMASNPESRKTFVNSVMDFLERYDFDGLDFDWEYPGSRGGKPEDKRNFVILLRELKQAFEPKGYILSSAVAAGKHFMDPAYDVPQMSKYLDIINVMCYDYHGSWETRTGHHAPLYGRPNNPDDFQLNVNFSINYWLAKGAPRNKIVLGMGTYGRAFTLRKAEDHDVGSTAPQKGQAGPYTREGGSLGYNEICEMKMKLGDRMKSQWDPYYMSPFSYWDRQWVGYDNMKSIEIKANYAKAMGLAGGMIWSIETDDFGGHCGPRYPLLNTIRRVFQSQEPPRMPKPSVDQGHDESTHRPSSTSPFPSPSTRSPPPPTSPRPSSPRPSSPRPFPPSTTTSRMPSSETPTTTTRCIRTSTTRASASSPIITTPMITTTTTTTTSQKPWKPSSSMTTTSTTAQPTKRPDDSTTGSTWWSSSTPWWPQKPSPGASASSEMWWSSTFPTVNRKISISPQNSIEEKITTVKNPFNYPAKDDDDEFICGEEGLYRQPDDCTKFIRCVETKIEGQFQLFFYECPEKTVFNNDSKLCDWVENVPECMKSVPHYYFRGNVFTIKNTILPKGALDHPKK